MYEGKTPKLEAQLERLLEKAAVIAKSQVGIRYYDSAVKLIGTGPKAKIVQSAFSTDSQRK